MNVAATPSGGAEPAARADGAQPSPHERLRAFFDAEDPHYAPRQQKQEEQKVDDDGGKETPSPDNSDTDSGHEPVKEKPKAEEKVEADDKDDASAKDDASEEADTPEISSIEELAEQLGEGWGLDKLMDLDAKVKIDGKEGSVKVRDLLKSYQLEGHLNNKLMTHSNDKKAFEAERLRVSQELGGKFQQMEEGLQVLEHALAEEFVNVNWEELQSKDPDEYSRQYVRYQQRIQRMQGIQQRIDGERQKTQEAEFNRMKSYREEQMALLNAKVPEWSDKVRFGKDKAEMEGYLKTHGVSPEDLASIMDHRQLLVIRDAMKWAALQKQKPSVLNKVRNKPMLLKPGAQRAAKAGDETLAAKQRSRLKETGKVQDSIPVFKRLLFPS